MPGLPNFELVELGTDDERLRLEVREFLADQLPAGHRPGLGMTSGWDPAFSRSLADCGWVGMAIPTDYGGSNRGAVERFIVTEELLAASAPVAAHWVADRQTAPMILHHGTEQQRRRFLPMIAAGTCFFSIGMSESEAGSDLAAVRTSAARVNGGWQLNGTKMWTSYAHLNHYLVALCRTSPREQERHHGLSQLIVDLSSPGVTVKPIRFLSGSSDFNEVVLDEVFVPDDMLLGEPGAGWAQVTSELVHERAGPDRFLSAFALLRLFLGRHNDTQTDLETVGRLVGDLWTIRQLALSVARMLDNGTASPVAAALVKDLGTKHEQAVVETVAHLAGIDPDPLSGDAFESLLAEAILVSPSFTIRGGTTEVLRVVSARAMKS
jgi:alkylation response protein AidB-like acyl-CoA dehydrogenase